MSRRVLLVGGFGAAIIAVIAACGQAADAPGARICTPGNYVFCRCKDRSEGTKLCSADGTSFGACEGCVAGDGFDDPGLTSDAATDRSVPPGDAAPPVGERPKAGELFVTEIMFDPSGDEPSDEWFEVLSTAAKTVTLSGMFIKDGAGRVHVLSPTPSITLAPNQPMVLVRNRAAAVAAGVPNASILGEYGTGDSDTSGILLTNGSTGALSVLDGANEIVSVPYGTFNFVQAPPGGASIQLRVLNVAQAKLATGWCLSSAAWAGQPASKTPKDQGSPGAQSNCQ